MFWKQSQGTEHSFLYVTTKHITAAYLASIQQMMTDKEFLIVACKSFDEGADKGTPQIRIKKIPQMLLGSCEFGQEDYALNIVRPPQYEDVESEADLRFLQYTPDFISGTMSLREPQRIRIATIYDENRSLPCLDLTCPCMGDFSGVLA